MCAPRESENEKPSGQVRSWDGERASTAQLTIELIGLLYDAPFCTSYNKMLMIEGIFMLP